MGGDRGLRYGLIIIIRDLGLAMDAVVEKTSIFECNSLLCNFISECNLQTYMHTLVHFGSAWLVKLDLSYGVCCSESLFCTFICCRFCIFCSYLSCELFHSNVSFLLEHKPTRQDKRQTRAFAAFQNYLGLEWSLEGVSLY